MPRTADSSSFAPAELPNVFLDPIATTPEARIKMVAWYRSQKFKGREVSGSYLFQSASGRDQFEPRAGFVWRWRRWKIECS